jgi:hypothetical protein
VVSLTPQGRDQTSLFTQPRALDATMMGSCFLQTVLQGDPDDCKHTCKPAHGSQRLGQGAQSLLYGMGAEVAGCPTTIGQRHQKHQSASGIAQHLT